jgi:hypothetical protein
MYLISYRFDRNSETVEKVLGERPAELSNAFDFFKAVVRGKTVPSKFDLSTLENNLLVVEILDAARSSVASGNKVHLGPNTKSNE